MTTTTVGRWILVALLGGLLGGCELIVRFDRSLIDAGTGDAPDADAPEGDGGQCTPACTLPRICCGGACVDPDTDSAHCGGCGGACSMAQSTSQMCNAGQCVHSCTAGFADCNGPRPGATDDGCEVGTDSDVANCGGCGGACETANNSARTCAGGLCSYTCTGTFGDCNGPEPGSSDDGCETDTATDAAHCGGCGGACSVMNSSARSCAAGVCNHTCTAPFADCDGPMPGSTDDGCEANTSNDPTHCGSCAGTCSGGTPLCQAGGCAPSCMSPTPTNCSGSCVDLATDPAHCGSCTNDCGANASCAASSCQCNAGFTDCDGLAGCEAALATDVDHCGSCPGVCETTNASARMCGAGLCSYTCTGSFGDCNGPQSGATDDGCETDTATTAAHCGACGDGCSTAGSTAQTCFGSLCMHTCSGSFSDCNGPSSGATDDGCEIDTNASAANCGTCGGACETTNNTAQSCAGGLCGYTCTGSFGDCNGPQPGASDDGCETDTAMTVAHCGTCGGACETTNNTARSCAGSVCTYTCAVGFSDCNGPAAGATDDGCEVNTAGDVANCGACSGVCETTNATARACASGQCNPTCASGWGDCNGPQPGLSDDGCETFIDADTANCGSCGGACSTLNASVEFCALGLCTYTCIAPFLDCNGPQSGATDDGCETNGNTDNLHCGNCTTVCSGGTPTCVAGICS